MARRGRGVFDAIMAKDEYMQPEQRAVPVRIVDMTTQDPDELVECPYDKVHRIRVSRFPMHLMKCRKNYTGKDMFTCPFNARHLVPAPEARHHIANCADKALIEKDYVYQHELTGSGINSSYCKGNTQVPNYNHFVEAPKPLENWDDEIELSNYRDRQYWGPTGDNNERNACPLPMPRGRGVPRNVGNSDVAARRQPEMRLPRQPAQAASAAAAAAVLQQHQQQQQLRLQQQQRQQHQVPQVDQEATVPIQKKQPEMNVAGLGRGQYKGQGQKGRVMAANLWGSQQSQTLAAQPPKPGGLGQSAWGPQSTATTREASIPEPSMDDFPPLDVSKPTTCAGIGRGLGRGIKQAP